MSRRPVLAVSVMLSLLSVESALGGDVPAPKPPSVTSDAWETYQSERGGFSVDVPATWSINERLETQDVLVTTLTPPNGVAVSVISQTHASLNEGDTDLPNLHCKYVMVAGRPATACLDTISFSVSTTVVGSGRTYVITSNRRRGDQRLYDRILASFRISQ